MEILKIEKSEFLPEVIFDADQFLLSMKGSCKAENNEEFFQPLINWLDEYNASQPKLSSIPLNVEAQLKNLDSSSLEYLTELFKRMVNIYQSGVRVLIEWYYPEDDDFVREVGEEISENIGLPFNFIEE